MDDRNYFQVFEYTMDLPPDTRPWWKKVWHVLRWRNG